MSANDIHKIIDATIMNPEVGNDVKLLALSIRKELQLDGEIQRMRLALRLLWGWAQEANGRLTYELAEVGNVQLQLGGNPYLNPIFKLVREALAEQDGRT